MIRFDRSIFMLGFGAVARCTLPLLLKHINIDPKHITIMDFVDNRSYLKDYLEQGITYVINKLTKDNYQEILSQHLKAGDLFIDLSWNVDTISLLQWCYEHNVLYINSSIEEWEPYQDVENTPPENLTLYYRHMKIEKMISTWTKPSATAIVDHGANPGLVSHFTKQALIDLAQQLLKDDKADKKIELEAALSNNHFPRLSLLTQTKVIHISERDTQIINKPKQVNEFVNTWSIEGLIEEGMAPAELGWGTHEKMLPKGAHTHNHGPQNQILLSSMGMNTLVRSWVPSGPIIGMVIRHGEAYGISERLTVWEQGRAIYRPTVYYAYCLNDSALSSLYEFRMRDFVLQPKKRIMYDEITSGADEIGCLLMGHAYHSWWIGSVLDIEQTRKLIPGQNSTTLQVAISIVAAAVYAITNPNQGFCLPDDIDHTQILTIAKPYLGEFISRPVNWKPVDRPNQFLVFDKKMPATDDIWQFSTFLVKNDVY
ncbi:MAG: saccharopine dehydrogenase C-terminal domain-containing protein [Candidatus Dependentiae bacterium]